MHVRGGETGGKIRPMSLLGERAAQGGGRPGRVSQSSIYIFFNDWCVCTGREGARLISARRGGTDGAEGVSWSSSWLQD